jgi:hypothetical protein
VRKWRPIKNSDMRRNTKEVQIWTTVESRIANRGEFGKAFSAIDAEITNMSKRSRNSDGL